VATVTVNSVPLHPQETTKKVQTHPDWKGQDRWSATSRAFSSLLFVKELVLTGQTVNSAYYCDVLRRLRENVRRLRPEIWRQETGRCITITHHFTLSFFSREFLTTETMLLSSPPTLLFCFPDWR
jgi:hypothetical protein